MAARRMHASNGLCHAADMSLALVHFGYVLGSQRTPCLCLLQEEQDNKPIKGKVVRSGKAAKRQAKQSAG